MMCRLTETVATCHNESNIPTPRLDLNVIIAQLSRSPSLFFFSSLPLAPQRIVTFEPKIHRGVSSRMLFGIQVPSCKPHPGRDSD